MYFGDFMKSVLQECGCKGWEGGDTFSSGKTPGQLKQVAELYLKRHDLKPGDLAQWKPGLKNVESVDYGKPVVIVEVIPGRRVDFDKLYSTTYEACPEEAHCGVFNNKGDFMLFWYDLNRLEPYEG